MSDQMTKNVAALPPKGTSTSKVVREVLFSEVFIDAMGQIVADIHREFNGKLAAMEMKLQAPIKFKGRFKGAWIDGQEYLKGDFVIHDGGALFWASADTKNNPSSGVDWIAANR